MRTSLITLAMSMTFAVAQLAAQPVITEEDFLSVGDRAREETYFGAIDVSGLTDADPTGDWDFTGSFGLPNVRDIECFAVGARPVDAAKHFPGADRAVKRTTLPPSDLPPDLPPEALPEFAQWEYYSCDPTGQTLHGVALPDPFGMAEPQLVVNSPPTVEFALPLTLGSQWTEEYESGDTLINDIRVSSTVDAWGTATFPGIGTVNCLRVTSEVLNQLFDATVSPPVPLGPQYIRTYTWVAEGIGVVARISKGFGEALDTFPAPGFTTAQDLQLLVDHTPASTAQGFIRGEVNGDDSYNVADPVSILMHVVGRTSLACVSAGDVDDDGAVNLADALYSLNYLFLRGPAPEAPFPACGPDPTPDDLECAEFAGCP